MNHLKAKKTQQGFTLIELLVVISIIALLSVIVMASMEDARNRARNSAKNQLVQQYLNALELYRSENNKYPTSSTPEEFVCLGDYGSGGCLGNINTDSILVNKISEYIPGAPADLTPTIVGSTDRKGVMYLCSRNDCREFEIRWILHNTGEKCLGPITGLGYGSSHTMCIYESSVILN